MTATSSHVLLIKNKHENSQKSGAAMFEIEHSQDRGGATYFVTTLLLSSRSHELRRNETRSIARRRSRMMMII